jgi:adenine-specific DNA-methyltransferase
MPTLHWVGKDKVVNHHHDVPFRLLDKQYTFTANQGAPTNSTANRIIHGDNLEALKSLLPEFEGKVNCIYIDPPYNTGNEGWVYNDAVNDPKIKKWLGQVVGKEGEDLSRHDKWLCMMYPRLKLLHRLLADDGVIFVSIDDNEQATLKLVLDEIFGYNNFIGLFSVNASPSAIDYGHIAKTHDYALFYGKNINETKTNQIEEKSKEFRYEDEKGGFNIYPLYNGNVAFNPKTRPNLYYPFYLNPQGQIQGDFYEISLQPHNGWVEVYPVISRKDGIHRVWRWGKDKALKGLNKEIVGYKTTSGECRVVQKSRHTSKVIRSMLLDGDFQSRRGTAQVEEIFGEKLFSFPKPIKLLEDFLFAGAASEDSIILDSFAGSGTTAHAVLKLNAQDGGNRRFILCETMDYAETITAERVRRVINGYGEGAKAVAGTGGGFDYYTVGEALFNEDQNLNEAVGEAAIRDYVAYTENIPTAFQCGKDGSQVSRYALGVSQTALWLFYYEREQVTSLNLDFLASLNIKVLLENGGKRPEHFIIYADKCALDKDFLVKHNITFKRIPRDITRF